jgi:PKD repeat protein
MQSDPPTIASDKKPYRQYGDSSPHTWEAGAMQRRLAFPVAAVLLLTLMPQGARASSQTTVGFDDLAAGTRVTNQHKAQGLELGSASSFGQSSPGVGDCGSPTVQAETLATGFTAASPPNYAVLPFCASAGPPFSGTYGALLGAPRSSLSVKVRNSTIGTGSVEVQVIGYSSEGKQVAEGTGEAATGAWQTISATLSGATKISYFMIRTPKSSSSAIAIDDLSFEATEESSGGGGSGEGGGGGTEGGGSGGGGGGGTGGSGGTGGGSGSGSTGGASPPTAALALSGQALAGGAATLSGAGSSGGSSKIISYDWDFNGDGKIDTSTGTNPDAHFIFTPGTHHVGLTVTNSEGKKSSTGITVSVPPPVSLPPPADGGEGQCEGSYEEGEVQILAECIQPSKEGGYVIQTKLLELNGMVLAPQGGGYGVFKIQHFKELGVGEGVRLTGPAVSFELLNTPIGDMVMGGRNLEAEPIFLSFKAYVQQHFQFLGHSLIAPAGAGGLSAHAAGASKSLIVSFAVGHECSGSQKSATCCPKRSNTACATLPGGFPLGGQVNAYIDGKGQLLLSVQVALDLSSVDFEASGGLEIIASATSGINLASLQFEIPEAGLAEVFKVEKASFTYYFPDDPEESKRDTWQAKGTIVFGPLGEPKMKGSLSFKKGQFHEASMTFTAPSGTGVPIYPGVLVNELGGTVGVEPLKFGGTIGASIATQLQLSLSFLYREESGEELGFFGGEGKLSFKGDEIAKLAADVYSDGYTDAQLKIDLHFPFSSDKPVIEVEGGIGFWDEPESGRWEANGEVHLKLWIINAEVAGLVNNTYAAGCLSAFGGGIQGRYRFSDGDISGGVFGFKSCSDELKQYKEVPLKKHSGGFVKSESLVRLRSPLSAGGPLATAGASGAGDTIYVASGQFGEELRIGASSGTPVVTLTSPSGKTYSTPVNPDVPTGVEGQFIAAVAPDQREVIVLLLHPQGGAWTLTPAEGAPSIARVTAAQDVPPPKVHAHVHEHRGHWMLAYRISNYVKGSSVQLFERGRDSGHVIATVHKAAGTIRFTPREALSRKRKVYASFTSADGTPKRTIAVAAYRAPAALRGGRVTRVRLVRRGQGTVVLSWAPTHGARGYRVKVRGSDGRLVTALLPAGRHTLTLRKAYPWDAYQASVRALAGADLLPGPTAHARLRAAKAKHVKIVVLHRRTHGKARKRHGKAKRRGR